jgi:hypothetical protein
MAQAYITHLNKQIERISKQDETLSKSIERKIRQKKNESGDTETTSAEETPVLSEQEIMELDAASRAHMLDKKNRKNYSKKQQEVIDSLNRRGREMYGKDWDTWI